MSKLETILSVLCKDVKWLKVQLEKLQANPIQQFHKTWIDGQEVMQTLHISKRTLQNWRDSGAIPFSRINGKFFYKVSDLETMLKDNYSPSKREGYGAN